MTLALSPFARLKRVAMTDWGSQKITGNVQIGFQLTGANCALLAASKKRVRPTSRARKGMPLAARRLFVFDLP